MLRPSDSQLPISLTIHCRRTFSRVVLIHTLQFAARLSGRKSWEAGPGGDFGGMLPAEVLQHGHVQLEEPQCVDSFSCHELRCKKCEVRESSAADTATYLDAEPWPYSMRLSRS